MHHQYLHSSHRLIAPLALVLCIFVAVTLSSTSNNNNFVLATNHIASQSASAVTNKEFTRQTHVSRHFGNNENKRRLMQKILKSSSERQNDNDNDEPFIANAFASSDDKKIKIHTASSISERGDAPSDLINVFFMHRHGARTSAIVRNNVPDYNGCVLSAQGELMAKSLGRFLNERYNGTSTNNFTDKMLKFFPNSYSPFKVNSWSTDFERTIRTGSAALQSMFTTQEMIDGGKPAVAPYLQHLPQDADFMLSYYYSWPAALLHQQQLQDFFPRLNNFTRTIFSEEHLTLIGNYLNASLLCKESPTTCVIVCEDFVSCELSNQPSGTTPLLDQVVPLFTDLEYMYHLNVKNNYLSVPCSDFWKGVGFFAAEVIRDMMRKARNAIATSDDDLMNDPATPVIHHYSAHDVTVYGLLVALGVVDENTTNMILNVPPFAATTLFELFRNGTMKFSYVVCNQTYNSDHKFVIQEGPAFQLNCMRPPTPPPPGEQQPSSALMYKSSTCPFEDIERAVNYTMATLYPKTSSVLEETMCYASLKDQNETNCHAENQQGSNNNCQSYRAYCQSVACSPTWLNGERFANYSETITTTTTMNINNGKIKHDSSFRLVSSSLSNNNSNNNTEEMYVFNVSDQTGDCECVKIVAFPGEKKVTVQSNRWNDILKSAGSKVGVFFMSVLLGIVFGGAIAGFVLRGRRKSSDAKNNKNNSDFNGQKQSLLQKQPVNNQTNDYHHQSQYSALRTAGEDDV